jgi:hypothetical protein
MARSEHLVVITVSAWERSIDRINHQTREFPIEVDPDALQGPSAGWTRSLVAGRYFHTALR